MVFDTTPEGSVIAKFNALDLLFAITLADRRNVVKEAYGVKSIKSDSKQSELEVHLIGVMGEYSVSRYLGVPMNTSISLGGDDKVSDLEFLGKSIQVKTRTYTGKNLELLFNTKEDFRANYAIAVAIRSLASVELVGYICRVDFMELCQLKNYGNGLRQVVGRDSLVPIEKIKQV